MSSGLEGDFALVTDLDNGTIYAGRMSQGLSDLSPLPLRGLELPVAIDYDPVEQVVYWSDVGSLPSPSISRAHLNGTNQTIFLDSLRCKLEYFRLVSPSDSYF